ncbi:ROK family protein [Streptomyces sp. NPDC048106]|uniref:ROK family protein n=1 Tax=Streptomyces sp. NPDC048106 TaxID=3155750 RepID=UPI0034513D20
MAASPSTARAINDRLALGLLQEQGPLTAGQLKQLTGLSRPTVADLVERLGAAGLITVVGESGADRRGPNARLYGIAADRAHLAALDVRTEGVVVLVADLAGRVLAEASVPIEGDTGTGPAVRRVVAAVRGALARAGVDGLHTVGIGAPGLIDPAIGDLRDSAGLPAWHRSLAAALQEGLPGARVTVENETNLAALAEQREGAARDRDTFVLLWLGHGTGAAVVLDGTLRRGASGGTGEIGFLPVPGTATLPSATDCAGGFHALAGAASVVSLAAQHGLPTPATADGPGAADVVRDAVARMSSGDGARPALWGRETRDGSAGGLKAADESAGGRGADGVAGPGERRAGGEPTWAKDPATGEGTPAAGRRPALVGETAGETAGTAAGPAERGAPAGGAGEESAGEGTPAADESARARGADGAPGPEEGRAGGEPVWGKAPAPREGTQAADGPPGPGPVPAGETAGGTAAAAAGADAGERFLVALAERIAIGVASVVAVLDPGCVVLGGEIGRAGGDVLAGLVAERLRRMSPLPTEVRAGGLGGSAVLRGALLTARDRAQDTLWVNPLRSPVPS